MILPTTPSAPAKPQTALPTPTDLAAQREKKRLANITRMSARLHRMVREAQDDPIGLLKLVITDDEGNPPTIKEFHKQWTLDCLTAKDVLHEAPRGSTKTITHSVIMTWFLGKRPELRCRILSDNDLNAKKRLRFIKELISKSDLLPLVFPKLKIDRDAPNDNHCLSVKRDSFSADPSVEAHGVLSSGVGSRSDLLWMDDLCSYYNVLAQPALQATVKEKVLSEWLPTCTKNACVWCTYTPWSTEDLNAKFQQDRVRWRYTVLRHGKPGNPCFSIFPELWSSERLQKELRTLGKLNYARAYECRALSADCRLILPDHLVPYSTSTLTPTMLARGTVVIVVDPAKGTAKSKDPDATGVTVLLVCDDSTNPLPEQSKVRGDDGFRVFVVEAFGFRTSTRLQADVISALCHHWQASYLLVEAQGLSSLHEWIYQPGPGSPPPPSATLIPYSTKESKDLKIKAITPLLDRAVLGLPAAIQFHPRVVDLSPVPLVLQDELKYLHPIAPSLSAAPAIEILRNLYDEAVNFGVSSHDDLIDSLATGLQWSNVHLHTAGSREEGGVEMAEIKY